METLSKVKKETFNKRSLKKRCGMLILALLLFVNYGYSQVKEGVPADLLVMNNDRHDHTTGIQLPTHRMTWRIENHRDNDYLKFGIKGGYDHTTDAFTTYPWVFGSFDSWTTSDFTFQNSVIMQGVVDIQNYLLVEEHIGLGQQELQYAQFDAGLDDDGGTLSIKVLSDTSADGNGPTHLQNAIDIDSAADVTINQDLLVSGDFRVNGDATTSTVDAYLDGTVVFGGASGSDTFTSSSIAASHYPNFSVWVKDGLVTEDVAVAPSTEWALSTPDYVFEEAYKLPSLKSVEKFIEKHSHLEGIPSRAEVAERGWSLPKMDQKLLKKVEELTLYAIEQEKQIQELKALVEHMLTKNKK